MKKARSCAVCGKMASRLLFNDKRLDIVICSKKCEHEYLNILPPTTREYMRLLQFIDDKIKKTKQREKMGWAAAGFGLLIILVGFLTINATIFIIGVFPLTCGAFSTSYFEDKIHKLLKLRRRILI